MKNFEELLWGTARNSIEALDVDLHKTVIPRDEPDNPILIEWWRRIVVEPARTAGIQICIYTAAAPREVNAAARLLNLRGFAASIELDHLWTPSILHVPPYRNPAVTDDVVAALDDLKGFLKKDVLKMFPTAYLEEKRVLASVNFKELSSEDREWLKEQIEQRISTYDIPLQLHVSDATFDAGGWGINKGTAVPRIAKELGLNPGKIAAFGDSPGDLPMLEAATFGMLGCPANAHKEVQDLVRKRHGYISQWHCLEGTLDAILEVIRRAALGGNGFA